MMTTALSSNPQPLLLLHQTIGDRRCSLPLFDSHSSNIRNRNPYVHKYSWSPLLSSRKLHGGLAVKFSLQQFPDPDHLDSIADLVSQAPGTVQGFVNRAEGLLYTLADAAVSTDAATDTAQKQDGGWLGGLTDTLETILKVLKDGLSAVHVPYAYGFAIILLTILVKAATFPLTKKQVESTLAMQNLQPKIKAIQKQYAGNQEMIQLETARLYKQAGVNPLAGCLPTLATLPVWIGLYRALSNVANEGLLTEGFFWIPSLAGPTTIASRQNGSGISWLFPFVDGHPPLGWSDTLAYLVLPVLLIVSQYISMQIMQPPKVNDPSQKNTQVILKFLPLMIGYFALSVPSGLSLYWLTNNILSTTQQVWFRKLGGVKPVMGKESGEIVHAVEAKQPPSQIVAEPKEIHRGERFKQLKAEEAKRKKERAEAARRAAEEASKAVANVAGSEHLHNMKHAEEAENTSSLPKSADRHDGDVDNNIEQTSDSSVEKESLEEVYAGNVNGPTSDNPEPKRNEQSKQRGAA